MIQRSQVQNHSAALKLTQPFEITKLTKWVPETPGNLVVKSNLSRQSGSVVLRQFNAIHKKGP